MDKIVIGIFLLLCDLNLSAQYDTINKLNTNNKKHGLWIVYLSQYLSKTDSIDAKYYGYELFDNGVNLLQTRKYDWKGYKMEIVYDSSFHTFLNVPMIDGKFIFYHKDSTEKLIEEYKKGMPYKFETYRSDKKHSIGWKRVELIDLSKQYEGQYGSYYSEECSLLHNDQCKKYWVRKYKGKWKSYRIIKE